MTFATELIADPYFNDPTYWYTNIPAGISVAPDIYGPGRGGYSFNYCKLGWLPKQHVGLLTIGKTYQYEVEVSGLRWPPGPTYPASIVIGGHMVLPIPGIGYIGPGYPSGDGWEIGVYKGTFVATDTGIDIQCGVDHPPPGPPYDSQVTLYLGKLSIMADAREESIMQAIQTACTGLVTTGSNVFRGRSYPISEGELPGLMIYGGPDTLQAQLSSGYLDWTLQVSIEAYVRTSAAVVDTLLTEIRKEVYTAIMTTPKLGLSYVIDTIPLQAYEQEIDGSGNQPIAKRRMEFTVQYRTSRTDISA